MDEKITADEELNASSFHVTAAQYNNSSPAVERIDFTNEIVYAPDVYRNFIKIVHIYYYIIDDRGYSL